MEEKKKKSKKERDRELRNDGLKKISTVNLDFVADRQMGDSRFETERAMREKDKEKGMAVALAEAQGPAVSSTFDALMRMASGKEGRTISDKIADSNRPTWEQYKKDNESKLDMVGAEMRNMIEYRAQLDREREKRLSEAGGGNKKTNAAVSESEDESDDDSENKKKKHKSKKEKKKRKKEKKSKHKSKKRSSGKDSDSDEDGDSVDSGRESKKMKKSESDGPMRLSSFINRDSDSDS